MARRRVTNDALFQILRAWAEDNYPGYQADELLLRLVSARCPKRKVRLPIPEPGAPPPSINGHAGARHSPDFRSVYWFGTDYTFSPTQAAVVHALWEAWDDGVPAVGNETLTEAAGSDGGRVRDLFRDHPAWGAMIVPAGKGSYRLQEPAD